MIESLEVKFWQKTFIKILTFTSVFLGVYILFFAPTPSKVNEAKNTLRTHKNTLIQSRISIVELAKLNPSSSNFEIEKQSLLEKLQQTNKEGLDKLETLDQIPKVDTELEKRFPDLLSETRTLYEEQAEIINEVTSSPSYNSGIAVLKEDKTIKLLTKQNNLILEFEHWIEKIDN